MKDVPDVRRALQALTADNRKEPRCPRSTVPSSPPKPAPALPRADRTLDAGDPDCAMFDVHAAGVLATLALLAVKVAFHAGVDAAEDNAWKAALDASTD